MQLSLLLVLLPLYIRASPLFEATPQTPFVAEEHTVDPEILRALETYDDPVDALLAARPALASQMAESRLLEVDGAAAVWMTEGDKLRLRKDGKGFVDFTEVGLPPQTMNMQKARTSHLSIFPARADA